MRSLAAAGSPLAQSTSVYLCAGVMSGWQAAVLHQKPYRSLIREVLGADNLCFLKSHSEWMDRKKTVVGWCKVREEIVSRGLDSLGKWSWQAASITKGKTGRGGWKRPFIFVFCNVLWRSALLETSLPTVQISVFSCPHKTMWSVRSWGFSPMFTCRLHWDSIFRGLGHQLWISSTQRQGTLRQFSDKSGLNHFTVI